MPFRADLPAPASGSPAFDPELFALRPWYHDFSSFGLDTAFLDRPISLRERAARTRRWISARSPRRGSSPVRQERLGLRDLWTRRASSHMQNQIAKEQHLLPLAEGALSRLGAGPSCVDLFCADGYYSCWLKTLAPEATVRGVDLDPRSIERAETVARKLELDVAFEQTEAEAALREPFDLVLCAGGLYHLADPAALLRRMRQSCRGLALIQSVVSLAVDDPDYLETPAPGWSHGSRFSDAWLSRCLQEQGFETIEHLRLELPANVRPEDRGSSYFLCR